MGDPTSGDQRVSCGTGRRVNEGYDNRILDDLFGDSEVDATIVKTRVLNRGRLGVKSPADMPVLG